MLLRVCRGSEVSREGNWGRANGAGPGDRGGCARAGCMGAGPGNRAAANMPRWTRGLHGSRIRGSRYGKCAGTGGRTARGPGPGGNARAACKQNPGDRGRAGGGSRQGFASAGAGRAGIFFEGLLTFLRTYWTAPGLSLTNDGVLLIMPRMVMMRPAGGAGGVAGAVRVVTKTVVGRGAVVAARARCDRARVLGRLRGPTTCLSQV